MRKATFRAAVLVCLAALGCSTAPSSTHAPADPSSPPLDRALFPAVGATSFLTANQRELLSQGSGDDTAGAGARGALAEGDADASAPAGAEPPSSALEPMPEPDPTRLIVEADIFKLEGSLLYVLHRYRGLLIFDVSDPDRIQVVGRLPFQAVPLEMYVRDASSIHPERHAQRASVGEGRLAADLVRHVGVYVEELSTGPRGGDAASLQVASTPAAPGTPPAERRGLRFPAESRVAGEARTPGCESSM
jgi:hypothetical protein